MSINKTKTDRLHDQLPKFLKTKVNPNWKALLESIGQEDERLMDLIEQVRKQFFVKTASRPYIDKLGANVKIDRPRFIGMDDTTLRRYIPVLAYQPKQVKLIIDTMLDLFFFKESTTAFIETTAVAPYTFVDGWELEYSVDGYRTERVSFNTFDFVDISNATANEIVGAINRQAKYSFAIVFSNRATKQDSIRLFTNTFGSKGSVEIIGGAANIPLKFNGFIDSAGNGNNTEWTVTKIGYTMSFQNTGGNDPGIKYLREGDIIINALPGNEGSFKLSKIDISSNTIYFDSIFGTTGVFTQTSAEDIKFIRPMKAVIYKQDRRAVTWETEPGKITIEMPTSPPVVRRTLAGSAHINGVMDLMISRVSDSSLELNDSVDWPTSGTFIIEEYNEIKTKIITPLETTTISKYIRTRVQSFEQRYEYTGKSGNILTGITPNLPEAADLNLFNISSCSRTSNSMTIVTTAPHNYSVGEQAIVYATSKAVPFIDMSGTFEITDIINTTQFKARSVGPDAVADVLGNVRVERIGLSNSGSKIILTDSLSSDITDIKGPYMWDLEASFLLSAYTGTIATSIKAGQIKKILDLNTNNIPETAGDVIFDFGTENQEGPVRYIYKPSDNSIALDPAYVFQSDHDIGGSITMINRKGAHVMSGSGKEFAPYITDTAVAREILQDIILTVKSVGIFVDFLVRYPEQLYATLDVYRSGVDPG